MAVTVDDHRRSVAAFAGGLKETGLEVELEF